MFAKTLTHEGHTRQFTIRDAGGLGWEVREQRDDRTVRESRYTDWHRVERALTSFEVEVGLLQTQGWTVRDGAAHGVTSV